MVAALAQAPSEDAWVPHDDLLVQPEFIPEEQRQRLLAWAREMRPHLNSNGPGRTFRKVEELPRVEPAHTELRLRLQDFLGLSADIPPEPMFGWYLSVISAGGAVHSHIDPTHEGMRHLRCNLFLQLPERGGMPIIERRPVQVRARTLLAFFPSERHHCSQKVMGERRRIILSFGYLVPEDYRLPLH